MFAIAAAVIVVLNRKTMFTREGAATDILMPGDEHRSDAASSDETLADAAQPEPSAAMADGTGH